MPTIGTAPVGTGGGSSVAAGVIGRGYVVPKGALRNLATARSQAAAGLFEIACFGDSTTYGAAANGYGGGPYYTWVRRLRENLLAAGLPDGGYGIHHSVDRFNADFNADSNGYPKVSAGTGFTQLGGACIYGFASATQNETITLQGVGTAIRLMLYKSSGAGSITYKVDNAAAVPVTLTKSAGLGAYSVQVVLISGLTEGVHTLQLTNSSSSALRAEFNVEWLRGNGIVCHRDALSGTASQDWSDSVQGEAKSLSDTVVRLGLTGLDVGTSVNDFAWGTAHGATPTYRNVKLAIMQIGTNDLTADSGTDSLGYTQHVKYLENLSLWTRTAKAAGADVILISPPYTAATSPQNQRYMGRYKNAAYDVAMSHGCAYVDFQEALGWDVANWQTRLYSNGAATNPHLGTPAYQAEADFLTTNVILPALG